MTNIVTVIRTAGLLIIVKPFVSHCFGVKICQARLLCGPLHGIADYEVHIPVYFVAELGRDLRTRCPVVGELLQPSDELHGMQPKRSVRVQCMRQLAYALQLCAGQDLA